MLFAAALNDEGMDWVLLAVDNMDWDEEKLPVEAGWQMAALAVQDYPLFYNALRRTLNMDPSSATASP